MAWNPTKHDMRERLWSASTAGGQRPPSTPSRGGKKDREACTESMGLPEAAIGCSDLMIKGQWKADDGLCPIYEDASEQLGPGVRSDRIPIRRFYVVVSPQTLGIRPGYWRAR